MRDFTELTCQEGSTLICSLLSRLTVTADRTDPELAALFELSASLVSGDLFYAEQQYHLLTQRLLSSPARHVSGNLFRDYLLYILLQRPHPFSRMAADGRRDEHLMQAMQQELSLLGKLFRLSGRDLCRMAQERQRELSLKPRQAKDNISALSTAVWSGGSTRPLPKSDPAPSPAPPLPNLAAPLDFEWASWRYGEAGLTDSFVSDEALEEIYVRLISGTSWRSMQEDLWNFFAAYGCGDFLQHRLFMLNADGSLAPLADGAAAPVIAAKLYEAEQAELMDNAIRFMRGEPCANLLLSGCAGAGKTAQALAIPYELPELRLVLISGEACEALPKLMESLRRQPLKFMVLLDDCDFTSRRLRGALCSLCALHAQPENVLLAATTRTPASGWESVFFRHVALPSPNVKQFSELVTELLALSGCHTDPERVHNFCLDRQLDERGALSFAAAKRTVTIMLAELT